MCAAIRLENHLVLSALPAKKDACFHEEKSCFKCMGPSETVQFSAVTQYRSKGQNRSHCVIPKCKERVFYFCGTTFLGGQTELQVDNSLGKYRQNKRFIWSAIDENASVGFHFSSSNICSPCFASDILSSVNISLQTKGTMFAGTLPSKSDFPQVCHIKKQT